jgi:hypothetical protein
MSTIKNNKTPIECGNEIILTGSPVEAKSFYAGKDFYSGQRRPRDIIG